MAGEEFVRVSTPEIRHGAGDLRDLGNRAGTFAGRMTSADPLRHRGTGRLADAFSEQWAKSGGPDALDAVHALADNLNWNADQLDKVAELFDQADRKAADQARDAVKAVRAG